VAGPAGLLLSIFAADILPVFLVAAVGYLLARYTHADVRALSRASLYGLSPCLMFDLLVSSTMSGHDFGRMAILCIMVTATMGIAARLAAIPLRLDRRALIPFMLVVMFSNGGNYGLPVTLFAFGREALTFATVYFLTSAVLTYTVGVSLAASGQQTRRQLVRGVARVPAVYAAIAAGLVLSFGIGVPAPIMTAVKLMSDAALPVMILVLGMQLERARMPARPAVVAMAAALSLLVAPAVAFASVKLLDLSGPALHAGIIQASMPTAVVTTVLALEFDLEPDFVTSVVVATTIVSPFTLTFLIAYLQRA
jgi:predicted permease